MRVLFLTNFYMDGSGGEEQSCQQVVGGLKQRGHSTLVLTSMHGSNNLPVEIDGVCRSLYLEMDMVPFRHSLTFFTQRKAREKHNLQVFARVLQQFEPDIIFIWGMWNLPRSLPAFAEDRYPQKVVYRFASYWPTLPSQHEFYWRAPGRSKYSRIPKQLLGSVALAMLRNEAQDAPLKFRHAICVSAATRNELVQAGIPVSEARIIYTGLEVEKYLNNGQQQREDDQSFNLLYAGRLASDKGIETAIAAMEKLIHGQGQRNIRLSLAGSGSADYENHLRQLVDRAELTDYVEFLGWVLPTDMPGLLSKSDALILPSVWPEPLSRAILEGMVSGIVVLATPTGGTPEIIVDGENGVLFMPNDAEDLAKKIAQLVKNPQLHKQIGSAGRQTILRRFTMPRMMDEIESYLQEITLGSLRKEITN